MGPGGQAGSSSKIENYMGFPTGLSGSDLAERAVVQAEKFGATLSIPDEVIGLGSDGGYHEVQLDRNEKLAAKCVLISSGATYRKLNVKNNDRYEGTGVYYAATRVEAPFCKHAQVVGVGGGNSAGRRRYSCLSQPAKFSLSSAGTIWARTCRTILSAALNRRPISKCGNAPR